MSATFTADEILYATSSHLKSGPIDSHKGRIVWELEEVMLGDWFIAIPSHSDDPHDKLALALEKGARGLIVNRRARYAFAPKGCPIITVTDTKVALLDLMRYWRQCVKPKVVGVSGSSGRRATMILMHQLLQRNFKTHLAFMDNFGWYGCVKEVFAMSKDTEILVFEVGAVERGDITRIAGALDPDLAVLTQTRHPLPSPERDAATASLYCELLETLSDFQKDRVAAIIYDDNEAVASRADEVLQDLLFQKHSQSGLSLAHRVPLESLKAVSQAVQAELGVSVSRAELWCAVEATKALGISKSTLEELLELDSETTCSDSKSDALNHSV